MDGEMHWRLEPNLIWIKWELTFLLISNFFVFLIFLFLWAFFPFYFLPCISWFWFQNRISRLTRDKALFKISNLNWRQTSFPFCMFSKCQNLSFNLINHLNNYSWYSAYSKHSSFSLRLKLASLFWKLSNLWLESLHKIKAYLYD